MAVTLLALALAGVAAATDVARHKIYNWTVYPGIVVGLALNAAASAAAAAGWTSPEVWRQAGAVGLGPSLLGFLLCGGLMVACFVLFAIGGGDVKLMAMFGALLGAEEGVEVLLWTMVLGACMGLVVLVWKVGPWRLAARGLRQVFWTLRLGRWSPLTPAERAQLQPPLFLAPSGLAALAIVRFDLLERLL